MSEGGKSMSSVGGSERNELQKTRKIEQDIDQYLATMSESPSPSLCMKLARSYERLGKYGEACGWAETVADADADFAAWQAASSLLQRCAIPGQSAGRRKAKVAVLSSYTTTQFVPMLRLAAKRFGIIVELYESRFGQFQQDIIDESSALYAFAPDFIVLVVHHGDVGIPDYSESPEKDIETELRRWTALWRLVAERSTARVVQYNFALPCEAPMGHLGARLSGSKYMMMQALNARLGEEAGTAVSIVDCERLSALFGKQRWFDPRYWHLAKHAVALDALPLLARHTAAVIGADLGVNRKCLVLDLDNTLWGGVIGEDGLAGIRLGNGVDGEAYVAFQEYLLKLKNKGIILAVCSKNNHADAIEPFTKHPEMRLKLEDIALFVANWQSKPDNIRTIANTLGIGLDALIFLDDNPVERAGVRQLVPEVEVIALPDDPSQYTRTVSQCLGLETGSFTGEDRARSEQYRARAQIMEAERSAGSIEEFYKSLQMEAIVAPFDELHMPRIAQLIGKTNQFNLTTRRHGLPQLRAFVNDPNCVHQFLRLRDRFTDHGLVSLMIAFRQGDVLDIDTWLMSCRVIGRTVETVMLSHLCQVAESLGCTLIRGTHIPSAKNAMVAEVYAKFGFELVDRSEGSSTWQYDLKIKEIITNEFIRTVTCFTSMDTSRSNTVSA
jgi:FkbH-like protein